MVKTLLRSSNMQKQVTFVIDPPLMMAQSRAESSRDTYNYGQYINQSPLNMIKAIQEYKQIQKKICRQKTSIMFNEICACVCVIYIYIYTHTHTHTQSHPSKKKKKVCIQNSSNRRGIKPTTI